MDDESYDEGYKASPPKDQRARYNYLRDTREALNGYEFAMCVLFWIGDHPWLTFIILFLTLSFVSALVGKAM